jgi:serine/threonine-protein kinase
MAFFVVMAGVIAYFVFSRGIIGDKSNDNKDRSVVVESFIGEIYSEDFVEKIENKGYTVVRCHNVREASLPENSIVRQDPEAGSTKLRPKDGGKIEVTLYVNYGLSEIMMPDCEATKIDDATRVIENQFNMYLTKRYDPDNITIIEQPDETVPKGYVISSIPQANKKIKISNDLKVTLYVSTGPESQVILMPDVIGKTQDEAKRIIEESGLSLGQIYKIESDEYSAGYVVSTSVDAGTEVETGVTAIDLYVSRTQDVIFQETPSENQDDKTGIDTLLDLRDQQ